MSQRFIGDALLNIASKLVFGRERPDLWLSLTPRYDYSFPSGHAMLSSAFAGVVLILLWRCDISFFTKWAFTFTGVLFVLAVGVSRLYLGVHFPTDILAGWMASTFWLTLLKIALLPSRPRRGGWEIWQCL